MFKQSCASCVVCQCVSCLHMRFYSHVLDVANQHQTLRERKNLDHYHSLVCHNGNTVGGQMQRWKRCSSSSCITKIFRSVGSSKISGKKTSAERRPVPSDQNAAVGRRRVFCCLCRADAVCFQQFPEWQLAGYNFPWVAFLYRELSDNSCFGQSVTSLESASRSLCGMTYVVELWLLCAFANFFPLFIAFHCTVSPGISAFHSVGFMLHLGTQDLYFSINTETNWLVNR